MRRFSSAGYRVSRPTSISWPLSLQYLLDGEAYGIMTLSSFKLGLLSDFNVQNLTPLLLKAAGDLPFECVEAAYGQATHAIIDENLELWRGKLDALFLWTLPQSASSGFQRVLSLEECPIDSVLTEVDAFAALVDRVSKRVGMVILPSWVAPGIERGLGPLELQNHFGATNALMRMNLRLADRFEGNHRVILLDAQRWLTAAGTRAYSPKLWYMSKTPFHNAVFTEAARDIVAACNGVLGRARKIVLLDLDETLWGGILGDCGWQKLRLGGHDPLGEAFVDFQKSLKQLMRRGIMLALVSKNDEAVALEAIRRHPEMILKAEDFVGCRINWQDKAKNIQELLANLNLGAEAAVFLDDSPFERARVREALPAVLVPDLPGNPLLYPSFLKELRVFDSITITPEDRSRTDMYVADRQRTVQLDKIPSLTEWLYSLDLRVTIEPLREANLVRAAQLFNKTNQMNLKTRRLTATELLAWATGEGNTVWAFRVADKFGDYGLCGLSSFARSGRSGLLFDFILSCRVFGRGIEETMFTTVVRHAHHLGCHEILAELVPTTRNQPCATWFATQSGFTREGNVFRIPLDQVRTVPDHVNIVVA